MNTTLSVLNEPGVEACKILNDLLRDDDSLRRTSQSWGTTRGDLGNANTPATPSPARVRGLIFRRSSTRAARNGLTATNSPPVFLVCGYNDRSDISEGLASVHLKFKQLKVPAELHIYAGSGHGFGLRANDPKPAGKWMERFEEWLADSGFLERF